MWANDVESAAFWPSKKEGSGASMRSWVAVDCVACRAVEFTSNQLKTGKVAGWCITMQRAASFEAKFAVILFLIFFSISHRNQKPEKLKVKKKKNQ